jgi:hypothetical protein
MFIRTVLISLFFSFLSTTSRFETAMLTKLTSLNDVIAGDYDFDGAALSPDGTWLAWLDRDEGLCVFEWQSSTHTCHLWPQIELDDLEGYQDLNDFYLKWSPGSTHIALAIFPFMADPLDSDLLLFDVQTRTFTNLTEDAFAGWLTTPTGIAEGVPVDIDPIWDTNESLLFIRAMTGHDPQLFVGGVTIQSVDRSTPNLTHMEYALSEALTAQPKMRVSSDQEAILLWLFTEQERGLWIINRLSGARRLLVDQTALLPGLPVFLSRYVVEKRDAQWVLEDQFVLMSMAIRGFYGNGDADSVIFYTHYLVTVETGNITPLFDLTDLNAESIRTRSAEVLPGAGILQPDSEWFLYFDALADRQCVQLSRLNLRDTEERQPVAECLPYRPLQQTLLSIVTTNGSALVEGNLLLQFD